jgi:hypothetical protein
VILQGSGYDPDGDQVYFSWSCTGGSFSSYSVAQSTFYAPTVSQDTDYICTLTVTDGRGGSTQAYTTVRVLGQQQYQPYDCCGSCRTLIEDLRVEPFSVCQGQSFVVVGRVGYICDCSTPLYKDPRVFIEIDGQYVGFADTDSSGWFRLQTYAHNWMYPHSRHRVTVRSQYDCCREGTATAYFSVGTCGRPCGCTICPCPQPCPCPPTCVCPPVVPPPPIPEPPCPTCGPVTPPPPIPTGPGSGSTPIITPPSQGGGPGDRPQ